MLSFVLAQSVEKKETFRFLAIGSFELLSPAWLIHPSVVRVEDMHSSFHLLLRPSVRRLSRGHALIVDLFSGLFTA